jgi:hypothetical protein
MKPELEKMMRASNGKIKMAEKALKQQWSIGANSHCLHNDWHSLAKSVGLSSSDIAELQIWVTNNGLKPPIRPKVNVSTYKGQTNE